MKYIFNNKGECVASSDSEVSQEWIDSIGGIAVESDKNYIISEIMLLNGVITVSTPQEVTPSKDDVVVDTIDDMEMVDIPPIDPIAVWDAIAEQEQMIMEQQMLIEELQGKLEV